MSGYDTGKRIAELLSMKEEQRQELIKSATGMGKDEFANRFKQFSDTSGKGKVLVHGGMKYHCPSCGREWFMNLEIGVEDHGKNGRTHQASPFMILCECGNFAQDCSGYLPLPTVRPLFPGMRYFKYDDSGSANACGIPSYYRP